MKKRIMKSLLALTAMVLVMQNLPMAVYAEETKTVSIAEQFPDAGLQQAVLAAFGDGTIDVNTPLSLQRYQKITVLDYDYLNLKIESLAGVEVLTNLKYLYLEGNNIESLSPLNTLINIESLDLCDNKIEDISPLSTLTELQELYLNNNKIQSIPDTLWPIIESIEGNWNLQLYSNQIKEIPEDKVEAFGWILVGQTIAHTQKEALSYSFELEITQVLKYIHNQYPDVNWAEESGVSLWVETATGAYEWSEEIENATIDFEQGVIYIPSDAIKVTGNYKIGVEFLDWGEVIFYTVSVVNKEDLEVFFTGLPAEVYVGDTFTLVPNRDGQAGETGWIWDIQALDATFNSPATFTAKKAGETTITYTTKEGLELKATITVKERSTPVPIESKPSTSVGVAAGDTSNSALLSLMMLMSGAYLFMKVKRSV